MTTPAGWYDDGSGRQRWWDGQAWTEHFAPEVAAAPQSPAVEETATDSIDDTVIRPAAEASAPAAAEPDAQSAASFAAPGETAATTPIIDGGLPPYAAQAAYPAAAPAAPGYESAAPDYAAPAYPAAAPSYPASAPAYPASAPAYPGAAPSGAPGSYQAADAGPKKLSVLGLVGLGLAVLGTILVFIPLVGVFGFVLLGVGFILSIVSLFLKGKKWPGIAGLSLAVVGTIIGIVMSFVYLFAFAEGVQSEIDEFPTAIPTEVAPDPEETDATEDEPVEAGVRPSPEEITEGFLIVMHSIAITDYDDPTISACIGQHMYDSELSNEALTTIANGEDIYEPADEVALLSEVTSDAIVACMS